MNNSGEHNHNNVDWGKIYCSSWFGDERNYDSLEIDQSPDCTDEIINIPEQEDDFIIEVETTVENETVDLPFINDGTYSGLIYWGDGNLSISSYLNRSHVFASIGVYKIIMRGTKVKFGYNNGGDKLKIKKIKQWGNVDIRVTGAFYGCTNLVVEATDAPDLTNTNDLTNMFRDCINVDFDFTPWDFSPVTELNDFMAGKGPLNFTTTNADNLLIRLSQTLSSTVSGVIGLGLITYTAAASGAVLDLTITKLWNLVSGGQV